MAPYHGVSRQMPLSGAGIYDFNYLELKEKVFF